MCKKVTLNIGREQSVERRHPWIFSRALQSTKDLTPGDVVEVFDASGKFLCKGFYEDSSIAIRILSFNRKEDIDLSFWRSRILRAYQLRDKLGIIRSNSAYRLINGEGDFLPGLTIDIWGNVIEIQAHHLGVHLHIEDIVASLKELFPSSQAIIYQSEYPLYQRENMISSGEKVLHGSYLDTEGVEFKEGNSSFKAHLFGSSGGGLSLEHWENRRIVSLLAKDCRVLNLYSRAGGFTLAALQGGAISVTSVDSSSKSMALLEENLQLNFDSSFIKSKHESVVEDSFKYLQEMPDGKYDMIILDPPPFAKSRDMLRNALKGYRKLNVEAMRKIKSGGIIFTFSCSQPLSAEQFRKNLFTSSLITGRNVRIISQLSQSVDFSVSIYHPEGEFLKGFMLYVE